MLTLTMIVGIVSLVTLIFIRFQGEDATLYLPDSIFLPNGDRPIAFTQTKKWYAIITDEDEIMFFDKKGTLFQKITVFRP